MPYSTIIQYWYTFCQLFGFQRSTATTVVSTRCAVQSAMKLALVPLPSRSEQQQICASKDATVPTIQPSIRINASGVRNVRVRCARTYQPGEQVPNDCNTWSVLCGFSTSVSFARMVLVSTWLEQKQLFGSFSRLLWSVKADLGSKTLAAFLRRIFLGKWSGANESAKHTHTWFNTSESISSNLYKIDFTNH